MIVPLTQNHIPQVAELHCRHVRSLLASLGPRVCHAFYRHALTLPDCFGFVDVEDGQVRGFVLGALDNARLFSGWRIRLELLLALATHPATLRRLLFHLGGSLPPAPELLYEAVAPDWRRLGIATRLTQALAQAFLARGVSHCEIRIDQENTPNLARHRKLGARIVGEFTEGGLRRYLLDKKLDSQ